MRYDLQQTLFVVQFDFDLIHSEIKRLIFRQPMLHDSVFPTKCNFNLLTVTEHHKVRNEWQDAKEEPKCDGFVLSDASGKRFTNQYPTASYGQTTDTGDRRFCLDIAEDGKFGAYFAENPDAIFEYHLLSDLLENIQRGIEGLRVPERGEEGKNKANELEKLYNFIVAAFKEAYPEYTLEMKKEPAWEDSTLLWYKARFIKQS